MRSTPNAVVERIAFKLDTGETVTVEVGYSRRDGSLKYYDAGCALSQREVKRLDAICREKVR